MILKALVLQNFRNYSKREFGFISETNLIVGPNAVGKTNILEAIYFLASGRSFRVKGVEREAIRYGEEIGRITGEIANCQLQIANLEIVLTAGEVIGEKTAKKRYFVNGVGKRQLDFLGNLRAVYFGPEDLELVTDSPSLRRKYLDSVLVQVDREYVRASLSYEKGLRQRNRLLEEMKESGIVDRRRLFFWDQLLIKNGNYITKKRNEIIEYLNTFREIRPADAKAMAGKDIGVRPACRQGRDLDGYKIEYDRSVISGERLAKYSVEEMAAGVTLVGPHRDDFSFRINPNSGRNPNKSEQQGRDLAVYGSRGEQRLAILWLKLGELLYIENETKDLPVLLLDDIFSELDVNHRKLVFDLIGRYQTIMTTADIGMVEGKWLSGVNIIKL